VGKDESSLVRFFRVLVDLVEQQRRIVDYHCKIVENGMSFTAVIFYGKPNQAGPMEVSRCMSCDLLCPLSLGIHGDEDPGNGSIVSKDVILPIGDDKLARCWLDGKARYMYVVTPTEHVSAIRELNDQQLAALWQTAVGLLESEGIKKFSSMIINHGKYMNHAHLHLKINVTAYDFFTNQKNWSPARQQQWDALINFNAPKLERILKKLLTTQMFLLVVSIT